MRFRPITTKYKFDKNILVKDYPVYIIEPLANWIKDVLSETSIWERYSGYYIQPKFLDDISILFRERFPRDADEFLSFIFKDTERTTNFLGLCIQNYAYVTRAKELEQILATGGSGYSVMLHRNINSNYEKGRADLVERVPSIILDSAKEALDNDLLLREAWQACYSRNPDYDKVVSKCVDALEHIFKNKYFPHDSKPVLTKFIKDFESNPSQLSYLGDSIINPKSSIFIFAKEFIPIRGHHTAGNGRSPTKEEAQFVLHYSIFIRSLYF